MYTIYIVFENGVVLIVVYFRHICIILYMFSPTTLCMKLPTHKQHISEHVCTLQSMSIYIYNKVNQVHIRANSVFMQKKLICARWIRRVA